MTCGSDVSQTPQDVLGVLPQIEQGMENDPALLNRIEETQVTFEDQDPPDIPTVNDGTDFWKDLKQPNGGENFVVEAVSGSFLLALLMFIQSLNVGFSTESPDNGH